MNSTRKKRGTLWGKPVDVCGQRYRIEVFDDLGENEGECDHVAGVIRIKRQAHDRMADTLLHELITHAAWDASGLKWMLVQAFQVPKKKMDAIEEMLARISSPAMLSTLRNAGWLRLPPVPPPTPSKAKKGDKP